MTLLRVPSSALTSSRFALSPLAETLGELLRLTARCSGPDWLRDDPVAAGLFGLLSTTKYFPDFVALPPQNMGTQMKSELASMRHTPLDHARATLEESASHSWTHHDLQWADRPRLMDDVAAVFDRGWQQLVAPDWTRRRAIMERDIRHRAGLIAVGGWRGAIEGMGRHVRWIEPDCLQFSLAHYPDRLATREGLVFAPHTGGAGHWTCEAPPRLAMVYPARAWLAPIDATDDGVTGLLGPTRTCILVALEAPTTPSQLALLLGVSLGTVSAHLARLRSAGAIIRTRIGRAVYYQRTPRGDDLAALL